MLPSAELLPLLNLVLTLLTIHMSSTGLEQSPPFVIAPVEPIAEALDQDHEVVHTVSSGVLDLFGEIEDGGWKCDIRRVVCEVGMGLVQILPAKGKRLDAFVGEWKTEVGEMWSDLVDIALLEVGFFPSCRIGEEVQGLGRERRSEGQEDRGHS